MITARLHNPKSQAVFKVFSPPSRKAGRLHRPNQTIHSRIRMAKHSYQFLGTRLGCELQPVFKMTPK